jgi:ATP-binding protein involved in chromosome partitioning
MSHPLVDQIQAALAGVNDPEIRRPITELGMVESVEVTGRSAAITILLTVSGCPMRDRLTADVTAAATSVEGIDQATVTFGVMNDEQRSALQATLRDGKAPKEIPFARPESLTKVYAIASGKGGVGKSSVTVNLAVAMARSGQKVGLIDADIYGHSIPAMLGIADQRPTQVDEMIMPVPTEHGPSVVSMGMFKPRRDQVVAWRGPMLDRALVQMLSDFYWGDLDVLLLDLPPGTGDIALSLGQHLPNAEVVVVTTPQEAAAEVAERAGTMAQMLRQRVVGVVENMSFLPCPHCGPSHRLDVFGTGGGERVAATLSQRFGTEVPLLGEIPLDPRLRQGGDDGRPLVAAEPDAPASMALAEVARRLSSRGRNLAGMQLGLTPTSKL